MFSWIWKSWFSPIYVVLRLFGVDPAAPTLDRNKALYCMIVIPKVGPDTKSLYKTGKRIFECDDQTIKDLIDKFRMWKNDELPYFVVRENFLLEDLTFEQVVEVRNEVKRTGHYEIKYDEAAEEDKVASAEAKREIRKRKRDDIVKKMDDEEYNYSRDEDGDFVTIGEMIGEMEVFH